MSMVRVLFSAWLATLSLMAFGGDENVARLINELQHGNDAQMEGAAQTLGTLGETARPAIPHLIDALGRGGLRYSARESLVAIGGPAVPGLVSALDGNDMSKRHIVMGILGRIGPTARAALPPLKRIAETDPSDSIRYNAMKAHSRIESEGENYRQLLRHALKDESPLIRGLGAQLLGKLGAVASSEAQLLIGMLSDQETYSYSETPSIWIHRAVRSDVAEALGKIGVEARPAQQRLAQMMKNDPDAEVRVSTALAVLRLDDGDEEGMQSLIMSLESGGIGEHPGTAPNALAELGPRAAPAFESLVESLNRSDAYGRMECIRAVAAIGDQKAIPVLTAALEDEYKLVQMTAAEGLGRFGAAAAPAVPALVRLLDEGPLLSWDLNQVVLTLGNIGPAAKAALPALQRLAASADSGDGKAIADAIKKISREE